MRALLALPTPLVAINARRVEIETVLTRRVDAFYLLTEHGFETMFVPSNGRHAVTPVPPVKELFVQGPG